MKVLEESIKAVIHICSNHNLHSWKRFFERKEKKKGDKKGEKKEEENDEVKKQVKKRYMGSLCRMMMARDYEYIKKIFYNLAVVSMSKSTILINNNMLLYN